MINGRYVDVGEINSRLMVKRRRERGSKDGEGALLQNIGQIKTFLAENNNGG